MKNKKRVGMALGRRVGKGTVDELISKCFVFLTLPIPIIFVSLHLETAKTQKTGILITNR